MPGPSPTGSPAGRRRGRILYSLLLLLFGVGVVPLVATSIRLVSQSREILELDQKSMQLDKARSLSEQVANYVRSLQAQITAIARTLEVEPGDFAMRVARIRQANALERYVGGAMPLNYISVVDTTGAGARSGIQIPEPAIEQLLAEGFIRAIQGKGLVSHPVISASLQEPVMVLSEPVRPGRGANEDAEVQGAVLVLASLGPLWNMTREMGQGGLFEVYIVDRRGRLIAHSDPARLEGDLDVSSVEIVRQFLASHGRAAATVPFSMNGPSGPVEMLGTYTAIAETGWGAIVQIDEHKAYYSAFQLRNQSLALVALVALVATFLGTAFARRVSRPIHELARSARRLAGGEYSSRVHVRSGNEVGVLADAFNQMGDEIQKSIEEIRQAAARNKSLFMGSIRMLANAIDEKDPYTRGHSERVAFYSMLVARHMGMSPDEVEKVHLSGIIHDVGKIGIEDKILRKPAALTEEEYEIMKQHPRKGEYILDAVPLLKQMAGAGLMHHENWDGSGYPDGLKGEQIPLLGRIVSVADAFDAMTTDRPYSKAMTFEAALARLRFLADKKFDTKCVDAIERAAAAGDLTPAKARRASVVARQQDAVAAR
ncbi:MAG TPA: HD domain-containing phosphohydrolase [Vicinamibacteria bacterium]|nr:HD domain-containing phosphohydrolase [Vicinamibacteria bacterium]